MSFVTNLKLKTNFNNDIFYCYFETALHKSNYYVVCYSIYNNKQNILITNSLIKLKLKTTEDLKRLSLELISEFLNNCFDIKLNHKLSNPIFIFHNFSYFSSFFILENLSKHDKYLFKFINRENTIYKCNVFLKKDPRFFLTFRDSFLLMQLPLEKFLLLFNITKKFKTFTFNTNFFLNKNNTFNELENISIYNVKLFQEVFDAYKTCISNMFNINLLDNLSLSSLSMDIFRLNFYNKEKYPIEILKGTKEIYVRSSYMGGITDIYKPTLINGYHYDINSLYPYIMMNFDMPVGKGEILTDGSSINIENFFGFLDVSVIYLSLKNQSDYPCLPVYDPNKGLISPKGIWRGIYFSEELKYAKKQGYIFKIHSGIKFKQGKVFHEFIKVMYEMRLKYKKTPLEGIIKLILNSLYGRFAMQSTDFCTTILDIKDETTLNSLLFFHEIKSIQYLTDKIIVKHNSNPSIEKLNQLKKDNYIDSHTYNLQLSKMNKSNFFNVAIQLASSITSYARIEMHKYKVNQNYNVFYSDTDSLFTDKPLPDSIVSEKDIGKFRLEGKVKEAFFVAPKLYSVLYEDGRKLIKAKGINKGKVDEQDIKDLLFSTKSHIDLMLNKNIKNTEKRSMKNILSPYKLSGTFYKRKKVFSNNIWIDTKPLYFFKCPFNKII